MSTPPQEPSHFRLGDEFQTDPRAFHSPEATVARFRLTVQLSEAGIEMMRQNIRRQNPEASEAEIAGMLRDWLQTRPGAEFGDSCGEPNPDRFA